MRKGVTLIEIIVAVALIALMAGVLYTAFNPAGELAASRNRRRQLDLEAIMNGIRSNIADQRSQQFSCASGPIPTSTKKIASASPNYNVAPCLIPVYLYTLPVDPSAAGAHYSSNADYDTGYTIYENSSTGQITLSAPSAELSSTISITR